MSFVRSVVGFAVVLVSVLASTLAAQAQGRLVISDIDDTIKASFVLSKRSMISNAGRTDIPYTGMPELYAELVRENGSLPLYYVSNAPVFMAPVHGSFLRENSFPDGELIVRKNVFERNFKIRKISEILREERPSEVLLIGDNGENDVEFYSQIRRSFPGIKFTTLIHLVYSQRSSERTGKPLTGSDHAFITSLDAAMILNSTGWLTERGLEGHLNKMAGSFFRETGGNLSLSIPGGNLPASDAATVNERAKFIPEWVDCRGYRPSLSSANALAASIQARLTARCSIAVHK